MIKQAFFIKSVTNIKDDPFPKYPKFFLIGKSNVGKSSFINFLTNRKKLAKISKKPGKTITLNFYLINQAFYLVDTPGYGYNKRNKELQKTLWPMLINFLEQDLYLKKIFYLIDFRIGPSQKDIDIYRFLIKKGFLVTVIFTKKDKIPQNQKYQQLKTINNLFNLSQITLKDFILISNKNHNSLVSCYDFLFKEL